MAESSKCFAVLGRVVLPDEIIENGAVAVSGEKICYVGPADGAELPDERYSFDGCYIAPGYVDIHCHASLEYFSHEDPAAVAEYHLSHGSLAMLETIYRNVPHEQMLAATKRIAETMKTHKNIIGVHLEGPYLNPMYGTGYGCEGDRPDPEKYSELISTGIIKQWTFAPEVEGSERFCTDIAMAGIVPAVGHSKASAEQLRRAALCGAGIVTHLFDATGCAIEPSSVLGTKEVDFDHAVLSMDNFYYEIICDKKGIHVRPENVKLAIRAAGIDRIVGITDSYLGPADEDSDVTFIDGTLSGSKLTMDSVAVNFRALGLSVCDVFKVCALNPAKAIRMDGTLGSIAVGKSARLLVLDDELKIKKIFI